MNRKPLDDLEMYELMSLAYPEKFKRFKDNEDDAFEYAQELADGLEGWEDIADLLGRVAQLAPLMGSPLSGKVVHCLGDVKLVDGKVHMMAVIKRDYQEKVEE